MRSCDIDIEQEFNNARQQIKQINNKYEKKHKNDRRQHKVRQVFFLLLFSVLYLRIQILSARLAHCKLQQFAC